MTYLLSTVDDERYKKLKFYFGKGQDFNSIIIDFPNEEFVECECNFVALCKGKKLTDKREAIKERDTERSIRKAIKERNNY